MNRQSSCISWLTRFLRRSESIRPSPDVQGVVPGPSGSGSGSLTGCDSQSSLGPSASALGFAPDTPSSNASQNTAQGEQVTVWGQRPSSVVPCSPEKLERLRQHQLVVSHLPAMPSQSNVSSGASPRSSSRPARNPIRAAAGAVVG